MGRRVGEHSGLPEAALLALWKDSEPARQREVDATASDLGQYLDALTSGDMPVDVEEFLLLIRDELRFTRGPDGRASLHPFHVDLLVHALTRALSQPAGSMDLNKAFGLSKAARGPRRHHPQIVATVRGLVSHLEQGRSQTSALAIAADVLALRGLVRAPATLADYLRDTEGQFRK